MGAKEKYEAALHGAEYTPRLSHVRAGYVRTTSGAVGLAEAEAQFARWLETVRAEAKAEALNEAANKLEDAAVSPIWCWDKCGDPKCPDDIRVGAATEIQSWLRARANQYKEAPSA